MSTHPKDCSICGGAIDDGESCPVRVHSGETVDVGVRESGYRETAHVTREREPSPIVDARGLFDRWLLAVVAAVVFVAMAWEACR